MSTESRERDVLDAVVSLVDSLLVSFDVVELLTGLAEQCARLLDVSAVGILLAESPAGRLHLMAATSDDVGDLELFQLQADEGPCLDCHALGESVSVPDLAAERDRWPEFVPVAVDMGFSSVHAVPLRAAGTAAGAMGLFGQGALAEDDVFTAQALAHVATVAILQYRSSTPQALFPALRIALADRVVVDQAAGFVRERLNVTIAEAFELLRAYARRNATHLTDTARSLLTDNHTRQQMLARLAALHEGYDL